jgi:CRP-like cAMP-binding protein
MASFFEHLSDEGRRFFFDRSRERRFVPGEVVCHQGDPADTVHVVRRGRLAVLIRAPRGQVVLNVVGPDGSVGEMALLSNGRRSATVTALEATTTRQLGRSDFDFLRQSNPKLDTVMLESLTQLVHQLTDMVGSIMFLTVEERLTRELAVLAAAYLGPEPSVVIPVSQAQLAGLVGATRQTVNRALAELRDGGIIAASDGKKKQVVVCDPERLLRIAKKLQQL